MPDVLGGLALTWPLIAAALGGYALGSIPFALILVRIAGAGDIRRIGSGNAAATLALDTGKAALAVAIAKVFGPDTMVLAGAGVVIGHVFPVWLKFRGGKGVATALGVFLVIEPMVGVVVFATWLAVMMLTRYSVLAAIAGAIAAPAYTAWLADPQRTELAFAISALVIVRHYDNIRRLARGEEDRIGDPP
jgi:glycerol-3-phosphate acyltransferase PlsY